jgi:hypothetical protein
MSLDNKKFKNNKTGEVVQVISSFENIAILENREKAQVADLLNPSLYTEEIDPSSFFSNQGAYNILADKIKNIPSHMIKDDDGIVNVDSSYSDEFRPSMNESAIVMSSEEDERAELARKYGASMDSNSQLQKQSEAFSRILGDSDDLPNIPTQPQQEIQRVEVRRDEVTTTQQIQRVEVEDPIITMFRKTKRNVEFKVNFDFNDKIPRLDFIEMMEDSYETSMIDFLADEFTNKILQDPSLIRNKIKEKIKQLVYGGEVTKSEPKVNDQITDSVTQVDHSKVIETEPRMTNESGKKTTTRKPRAKKETVEK